MKAALYYTIRVSYGHYEVMAVTSEKRRQVYGRLVEDRSATHVSVSDTRGRFDSAEAALARVAAVKAVARRHESAIRSARGALDEAYAARDADTKLALEGKIDG